MTIKQLKRVFHSEISHLYPQTEVDSFFYLLAEEFLLLNRVDVALKLNEEISIPQKFHDALNDLIQQKPIQYILGETEFYGLDFKVNKDVLIPRPETEELVDWIIKDYQNTNYLKILDIGTGSGCIAISLAKNIPNSKVTALDVSEKALETAKLNAQNNSVEIQFILDDILDTQSKKFEKQNIIVSNPPYVRNLEKEEINDNVLKNEPHLALFVKDDNALVFYNAIADFALKNLTNNGVLYFEINQYLGKETVELLISKGFKNVELKKDIFNNDRMIKAFHPNYEFEIL